MEQRPSPGFGLRQARLLWRMVRMVWVVSTVLWLPPVLVLSHAAGEAASGLPAATSEIAEGDLQLITLEVITEVAGPASVMFTLSLLGWWLWTVLWHAGVVSWQVWVAGRVIRLGELIGLGVSSWWRFFRLSLTAAGWLVAALLLVWSPLLWAMWRAYTTAAGTRLLVLLAVALLLTLIIAALIWGASLWGIWLLGAPGSRSAFRSWSNGLLSTLRLPLSTFTTIAAWLLPALLLTACPLVLGYLLAPVRGGAGALLLALAVDLLRSFCWVGLLCSFAPVTGLWPDEDELSSHS